MWDFSKIRQLAIDSLQSVVMDPAEKYLLARETDVDAWLLPSLRQLATREESLSMADFERLGIECVLKLARLRESRTPALGTTRVCQAPSRGNNTPYIVTAPSYPAQNNGGTTGFLFAFGGNVKCGGVESACYVCGVCSAKQPIEGMGTGLDDSRIVELFELAPLNKM
jgi:hypothetical protein